MKKIMYFMMGAGTVVAGFLAYALLRDSPESCREAPQAPQDTPAAPAPPRCSSQDYVVRRREFMQRRAAERTTVTTEPVPDISQATSQLTDIVRRPSTGRAAEQSEDFDGTISPTQEEQAAGEDPKPAVDPEDPTGDGNGETDGCTGLPSRAQPADNQNIEGEPSKGAESEESDENQTK